MLKKLQIVLIILLLVNIGGLLAIPGQMNYRGKLFESGSPVTGSRNLRFIIFDDPFAGAPLWDSGVQSISINNGYYNYTLGTNIPIPSFIFTNNALFLEVAVEGSSLLPRERLVAVAYAFNSDMVDGKNATAFAPNPHNHDTQYVNVIGDTMTGALINQSNIIVGPDAGSGLRITTENIKCLDNNNMIKLKDMVNDDIEFRVNDNMKKFVWVDDNFGFPETLMELYYEMADFTWYVSRKTNINYDYLKQALFQQGPWAKQILTIDKDWI